MSKKHKQRSIVRHTPVRFVSNAGTTSFTVLSTNTPPTKRKHLRSGSASKASLRVDRTKLRATMSFARNTVKKRNVRMFLGFLLEFAYLIRKLLQLTLES